MLRTNDLPSAEYLRTRFQCDFDVGVLIWRPLPPISWRICWNSKFAGREAAYLDKLGYLNVSVENRTYKSHRIVWAMKHGDFDSAYQIDHINGIRSDNRIFNLRLATYNENRCNTRIRTNNTSGEPGVALHKESRRFRVVVRFKGVRHQGGYFDTFDEAVRVRRLMVERIHGEFAAHLSRVAA